MRGTSIILMLAGVGLVAAGCDESPIGPPGGTAALRLLHASAATGAVDVLVGTSRVISNVTFGNGSAIAYVAAGSQELLVRSGSQVLGQLSVTLSTSHVNTVVLANGSARLSDVVTDTGAVNPTRGNVRLVNVVGPNSSDPTLLQALLSATNQQGQAPDSVQKFGFDAKVASYGTLMYLTPGQVTVKFVPQGTSTVLTQVTFAVAAGEAKAVVLERAAGGAYTAQVVTEK